MAAGNIVTLKSSEWFFNKSLKLSLPWPRKSNALWSPSPMSPAKFSSQPLMSPAPLSAKPRARDDELQEVFRHFDANGNGKISSSELKTYFSSIGEYLSLEEAQGLINDLDMDCDGLMDFSEFARLMERDYVDDDIKKAFEMFEAEKGSGCITPKSLQRMLNRLGDDKSHDDCKTMIRVYDLDQNGVLDFYEFHRMMT